MPINPGNSAYSESIPSKNLANDDEGDGRAPYYQPSAPPRSSFGKAREVVASGGATRPTTEGNHPVKPFHDVLRKHGYGPATYGMSGIGSQHTGEGGKSGERITEYQKPYRGDEPTPESREGIHHPSWGHIVNLEHDRDKGKLGFTVRHRDDAGFGDPAHKGEKPEDLDKALHSANRQMRGKETLW